MERLTERFSNGQAAVCGCGNNCKHEYKYCHNHYEDCPTIGAIYEKLATYEDAEEQGLLLRLPCKVGDYAWDLIMRYRFEIVSIEIRSCGTIIFRCGNKGTEDYASFSLEDIGETWMLTEPKETDYWLPNKKEEAEQALKHTENAR